MTSLTDRYVWAAVRTVPERQRADLEPEIRELVGESIDARRATGETDAVAERGALMQLGDPERLAAAYVDRPLTLIGPKYFLDWFRVLKIVLLIAVPISTVLTFLAEFLATDQIGPAIGGAVTSAIGVTINVAFWTTLLFAVLERGDRNVSARRTWTPDALPPLPHPTRRARLGDMVGTLVFLALFGAAIVGQQFFSVVRNGEESIPFLEPDLWSFWLPWFLVLLGLEAAFAVWLYLRGWSWVLAFVNLLLNVAFTVPALLLWTGGRLLNPEFVNAAGWAIPAVSDAGRIVGGILVVVVVAISTWDVIEGFLKAWRARKAKAA